MSSLLGLVADSAEEIDSLRRFSFELEFCTEELIPLGMPGKLLVLPWEAPRDSEREGTKLEPDGILAIDGLHGGAPCVVEAEEPLIIAGTPGDE